MNRMSSIQSFVDLTRSRVIQFHHQPFFCLSCRYDGSEENDGEAGRAQDPFGDEEDDLRGDGRHQRHHQLQRLCKDDAGEALGRAETVSPCAAYAVYCADAFCSTRLFIGRLHV